MVTTRVLTILLADEYRSSAADAVAPGVSCFGRALP
jgi:hypothetical protein